MFCNQTISIMAFTFLYILCIFLSVLPYSAVAQGNGTISIGSYLTAVDNAPTWHSPSGDFAFGFQKVDDDGQFLLSIWYDKIPNKTIVWFVNDGTTVGAGSKVQLTAEQGLLLSDSQGKELWRSELSSGPASKGVFNDTGNFIIVGNTSSTLWDSFSNPTDTLLPTQTMEVNGVLYSRLTETNFTKGRFQLRLLDGKLVLNTRDTLTNYPYEPYWDYTVDNVTTEAYQLKFNEKGYIYILRRNGSTSTLTINKAVPSPGYYHRATLNYDGVLVQYYHPKVFTGTSEWTAVWQEPDDMCAAKPAPTHLGAGTCGFNSVCTLDDSRRAICECPESYSLIDPNIKHGGCKPNYTLNCDHSGSSEDLYDFVELIDTDWPYSGYEKLQPISERECKRQCLQDCFCAFALYQVDICWKKKLPLINGWKNRVINGKAFLKFNKGDLRPIYHEKKDKNKGTLVLVGSVLLGSSVLLTFIMIVVGCLGFSYIRHKKTVILQPAASNIVETNVRHFTNNELVKATNGFKEELGRGAFGIVYKGVIEMSSPVVVAVKKIDGLFQESAKEFKTEVNVIAQTHHKNLVRLIGYCEEGEHRLLVYEFMVNGTLASLIFGGVKSSWALRSHIALGIAKGLVYLHEECKTQIIHCDIKPQNILLDENFDARISDFGLAKLMMQSRTNTGIRGTKGYVAPDWFRKNAITVKVDVYSFGVLLLEIICCRRNVENPESGDEEILTDWVWDCFQNGRMVGLVENNMDDILSDWETVERFVKIGLWCIQEDPCLRPTMSKVVQMLEGVVDVPDAPCPFSF